VRAVERPGWVGDSYLLGDHDGTVINPDPANVESIRIQPPLRSPICQRAGDLAGWQAQVARFCQGNHHLLFAVSIAFAGSLVRRVSGETTIFHLLGNSSSGKTTAQLMAGSVMGTWKAEPGTISPWRATDNGIEGLAATHNDGVLILDELKQLAPQAAAQVAYMIANGQGKVRADLSGSARPSSAFVLTCLSSGEISLAEHAASHGDYLNAGAELRFLDIPADAGRGMGVFADVHSAPGATLVEQGKAFAEQLKAAAIAQHGSAGPVFIEKLAVLPPDDLHAFHQLVQQALAAHIPASADRQIHRVASRFAVVATAGELATKWGITTWAKDEAQTACIEMFKLWVSTRSGVGNAEEERAVRQVRESIERHGARFQSLSPKAKEVPNRLGFIPPKKSGCMWYFLLDVFRTEVVKGVAFEVACRGLHTRGFLDCSPMEKPHHGSPRNISTLGGLKRVIIINSSILA
jgi:uncharacterized protein (DUF927 family)